MFGSALVGGLVGFAVGSFTRFEVGLTVGLVIFGSVTLGFAWRCYDEYRVFANAGTNALWGEVTQIVDKPSNESGSITSPAPIVRFTGPDGKTYVIEGPTASSARVGEHLNVIFDPERPERSRVGSIGELRGGAIALMLFGTFPISFAVMMVANLIEGAGATRRTGPAPQGGRGGRGRALRAKDAGRADGAARARFVDASSKLLFAALFCSIVWIAMDGADLLERFAQGFTGIAASLTGYALWGAFAARLGVAWTVGLLMLALNFGVWSFALRLLS